MAVEVNVIVVVDESAPAGTVKVAPSRVIAPPFVPIEAELVAPVPVGEA